MQILSDIRKMRTLNLFSKFIILFFVYLFFLVSCDTKDKKLRSALELAGDNKEELLKVIDHYQKEPADSLKLRAARFLIENMPGHFSYDTTYLYRYRPVIDKINLLRTAGFSKNVIKRQVNPVMDSLSRIYPLSDIYSNTENDISSVKSDLLINTIEQAFKYYNCNPFNKDSILFNDFLEYALPYRIKDGYCLEDWRSYFSGNYSFNAKQPVKTVHQFVDSMLYHFKEIRYIGGLAEQYPYIKISDYLKSQMAHCTEKCWLNCMILRSAGIPVTIDFVPASRVHEVGHEWNVLKLKDDMYPFEPFWIANQEKKGPQYLKAVYGKKKDHPETGPIQFPKIYRKTYQMNISELLNHAINTKEEIPPLFRNPFLKDVTDEYFKIFKLEIPVLKNIKDVDYAYACVMGANQRWVPVDYGKIKKGEVFFTSLGSKNVYLPAYYQFSSLIPAAYPALINQDGATLILCPDTLHRRKIEISYVAYSRPEREDYKKSFIGCTIEGADNPNFRESKVLYRFDKAYEPGIYHIPLQANKKYRFLRFKISNSKIKINEIKFLITVNGAENEIKGNPVYSFPGDSLLFKRINDGDKLTGTNFSYLNEKHKHSGNIWVGYDFKRPVSISAFELYYVLDVNVRIEGIYELLYWDFGWKSLGIKTSGTNMISFDNVPKNALLMIKIHDTNNYSRIFTYSDGKQHWW